MMAEFTFRFAPLYLCAFALRCNNPSVIALLDYGSGNLRSVQKALLKVGAEVHVVKRPNEMAGGRAAELAGVGAFGYCIPVLGKQEMLEAFRQVYESGRLSMCILSG